MAITGVSYRRVNGTIEPIDILKEGKAMAARNTKLSTRKEVKTPNDTVTESEYINGGYMVVDKNIESDKLDAIVNGVLYDNISNPDHYTAGRKYEPRKVIMDWDLNFYLGNVVKYISRAGRKGDALLDLMKAKQYLEWEIERLEEREVK